jgi:2,4-dienoyl-CoA reductase-like NADH-dependent reductase (Old Yellow Enzyme family)/thioredoxin reductase
MSSQTGDYQHLLSPLTINSPGQSLTLRNRVMVSAHVPGFAQNNLVGPDYIAYHRRYAAEGVGLQLTGGTPVHKSGLLSLKPDGLWNLDDNIIPGYQKLSNAVQQEGGRILAQLAHSGGTVAIDLPGVVPWSASSIRSAITGQVSHAMTIDEIHEVIAAFASAAGRAREGGMNGVEILAAFGYLPQAFLSPLCNHRTDEYGGTLENRMRFLVELLTEVRKQLAPEQILGVRLPGDELEPGGLTLNDMQQVCQVISNRQLADYVNVIAHTNITATGRAKHWAPTPAKHGLFVHLASAIKEVVNIPVFTVGRIIDPLQADQIIATGKADMVGMTRAHICDPTIVSKIKAKKVAQIRPCVGANTCIANRYTGKSIRCMHNPELGRSNTALQPAMPVKQIAVIGAGPAGLEAARICATRGHNVTVYEASSDIGGQLKRWASVKSTAELRRIIQWRKHELQRMNVTIALQTRVTTESLPQITADEFIIATGATETIRHRPVKDQSSPVDVLTPGQLLQSDTINATNALVVSDGRGQAGLVCAEYLISHGVNVEIVTEDTAVANDLDPTNRTAWYERLGGSGVTLTPQSNIELSGTTVKVSNIYSNAETTRENIDLIIDWNGCMSDDSLTHSPAGNIHAIGDCVSPRSVELAMAEAFDIASTL